MTYQPGDRIQQRARRRSVEGPVVPLRSMRQLAGARPASPSPMLRPRRSVAPSIRPRRQATVGLPTQLPPAQCSLRYSRVSWRGYRLADSADQSV